MADTPTQTAHPWRATVRTVFAFIVAVAAIWPTIVEAAGVNPGLRVVALTIAVAGAITRVMALPGVVDLFARFRFLSWLTPTPTESAYNRRPYADDTEGG
ncbi:hypothetical protein [Nocardioides sp.]|uniref:hypothetical protein n=1 Tax=Nocardioides sp. TaxID=35761 RepID=UPI0039E59A34